MKGKTEIIRASEMGVCIKMSDFGETRAAKLQRSQGDYVFHAEWCCGDSSMLRDGEAWGGVLLVQIATQRMERLDGLGNTVWLFIYQTSTSLRL